MGARLGASQRRRIPTRNGARSSASLVAEQSTEVCLPRDPSDLVRHSRLARRSCDSGRLALSGAGWPVATVRGAGRFSVVAGAQQATARRIPVPTSELPCVRSRSSPVTIGHGRSVRPRATVRCLTLLLSGEPRLGTVAESHRCEPLSPPFRRTRPGVADHPEPQVGTTATDPSMRLPSLFPAYVSLGPPAPRRAALL